MIDFMILGAPRSGTAWAANWLTTERMLCLHDVLFDHDIDEVDKIPCDRILGVADTGLGLFPAWLEAHTAKKVILHRDQAEINQSLRRAGLPVIGTDWYARMRRDVTGLHVDWNILFDAPQIIHDYLFGKTLPFDAKRHALLARLNVQADFEKVDPDPVVARKMVERVHRAIGVL